MRHYQKSRLYCTDSQSDQFYETALKSLNVLYNSQVVYGKN